MLPFGRALVTGGAGFIGSHITYIKYRAALGLSIPRQTRYIYPLWKLPRFLLGKK